MLRAAHSVLRPAPRCTAALPAAASSRRPRARAASQAPLEGPPTVVLLGGLNMHPRALERVAGALYPGLATQRLTHSLNDLVNVNWRFARNRARLAAALAPAAAGPGGAVVHVFSGAAYFTVLALQAWGEAAAAAGSSEPNPAARIRGIVMDSVPYERVERQLMVAARVPSPLIPAATALASRLLVSPAFGATVAITDGYNAAQLDARTYSRTAARRLLVAHSADDDVVAVAEFRAFVAVLADRPGWHMAREPAAQPPPAGSIEVTSFEGVGRHAAMVLDDTERYAACVHRWMRAVCDDAPAPAPAPAPASAMPA